jgi:hypothetical protein
MRIFFFLLLTAVLIAGCKNKNSVPGNVLPPDKMQAVLWDMMRADQFLTDYVFARDTSKNKEKESIRMYEQIFGFHKITKEEFTKSFAFYRANPLHLQGVMDSMAKRTADAPTKVAATDSLPPKATTADSLPPLADTTGTVVRKKDTLPVKIKKTALPL